MQEAPAEVPSDNLDIETVPTTAADVESAGRSCMVIVILGIVIVLLFCAWIVFRSMAVSP